MSRKLSPVTALLLTVPPLMWAGNAVVGRMVSTLVPPITLNFLRWAVAFFILLPLGAWVLRRGRREFGGHGRDCSGAGLPTLSPGGPRSAQAVSRYSQIVAQFFGFEFPTSTGETT